MTVTCTLDDGVAEIHLDRPDRLNSLDAAMVADFHRALDEVGDARAVLVTAAGRAFSAGRDLTDAEPLTEDAEAILRDLFNPLLQRIADLDMPTIAAVQGACLGVGLGVAFACDVVIVADDARIGSPFARIGAVLDSGGHRYLVERARPAPGARADLHRPPAVGHGGGGDRAGQPVGAGRHARRRGAGRWRGRSPAGRPSRSASPSASSARSRRSRCSSPTVLAAEGAAQGRIARSADYAEGITAFQEKRQPTFTGR